MWCANLWWKQREGRTSEKKQNPRTELTFTILLNSTEFESVFKLPCGDQKTNQLMVENTRDHAVCHINSFQGILNSSDVTGNGSVQTVICSLTATAQLKCWDLFCPGHYFFFKSLQLDLQSRHTTTWLSTSKVSFSIVWPNFKIR